MDRKEYQDIIEKVKAKTIPTLRPFIAPTVDILGDILRPDRYEVADVIEAADRLASELKRMGAEKGQPEQGEVSVEPTVTNEFLSDLITPWIQDIRQEIFNTRVRPFRTHEQAVKWVDEGIVDMENWFNEVRREKEKLPFWARPFKYPFDVLNQPNVPIPRLAQELDHLLGKRPLYLLFSDRVKEVARVTGFSHMSVWCHIIGGTPLTLNKVDTTPEKEIHELPSGEELVSRFVTVQIRGELTFDELRRLYQQIRQDLGVKRSKALNDTHLELYRLVKKRGGPVKGKGSVTFWKQVMEDWNKEHEGDQYKIWKSAKRAYDLLWNKLRSQYLVDVSIAKNDKPVKEKKRRKQK